MRKRQRKRIELFNKALTIFEQIDESRKDANCTLQSTKNRDCYLNQGYVCFSWKNQRNSSVYDRLNRLLRSTRYHENAREGYYMHINTRSLIIRSCFPSIPFILQSLSLILFPEPQLLKSIRPINLDN